MQSEAPVPLFLTLSPAALLARPSIEGTLRRFRKGGSRSQFEAILAGYPPKAKSACLDAIARVPAGRVPVLGGAASKVPPHARGENRSKQRTTIIERLGQCIS